MVVVVLIHESRLRFDMKCRCWARAARHGSVQFLSIKLLQACERSGVGNDDALQAAPRGPWGQLLLLLLVSLQSQEIGVVIVVVGDLKLRQGVVEGAGGGGGGGVAARPECGRVVTGRGGHGHDSSSHGLQALRLASSRIAGSLRVQAVSTHLFLELYCR